MKAIVILAVFGLFSEVSVALQKNEYITLESSGEKIASSCRDLGRSARQSLVKQSSISRRMDLLMLMDLVLCGDAGIEKNKEKLFSRLARFVDVESEGAGQERGRKSRKRSIKLVDEIMAGGDAYGDQLNTIDNSRVKLSYYLNEACISDLTFVLQRSKWMIAKRASACD